MKLLVACSSLDLQAPFSSTPAWWQLLKGLYEAGVDLVVTTYHGRTPETLWWRACPNPTRLEGNAFAATRAVARRLRLSGSSRSSGSTSYASFSDAVTRRLAQIAIAPRWERHLRRILLAESDVDAVLWLSVPPNHLRGVAAALRRQFRLPVLFYDGDVPASLPNHDGFATGFRIYDGADLHEFNAVLCNSEGGAKDLRTLGAEATHVLHYAADPQVYQPINGCPQDIDIFFYGHTTEYREDWLEALIAVPSDVMREARFAVRGRNLGRLGRAETLPYLSFSRLRDYVARSKLNLVITRAPHANVYGSSSMRPFELAMLGACMICSPYLGIEQWFEPGKELILVNSAEEAIDRYRFLLSHDTERQALGAAARRRALAEHTFLRRAEQLVRIIKEYL
jgi:glycosyltransferase involved in cell wall biosynthesis